jgi:hypothetical protein
MIQSDSFDDLKTNFNKKTEIEIKTSAKKVHLRENQIEC